MANRKFKHNLKQAYLLCSISHRLFHILTTCFVKSAGNQKIIDEENAKILPSHRLRRVH